MSAGYLRSLITITKMSESAALLEWLILDYDDDDEDDDYVDDDDDDEEEKGRTTTTTMTMTTTMWMTMTMKTTMRSPNMHLLHERDCSIKQPQYNQRRPSHSTL